MLAGNHQLEEWQEPQSGLLPNIRVAMVLTLFCRVHVLRDGRSHSELSARISSSKKTCNLFAYETATRNLEKVWDFEHQ